MNGLTRIEPDGLVVTARAVPDPDAAGRPVCELEVIYPDPDVNQHLHHVCLCYLPGWLAQHPEYGDHLTARVCHEYHGRGYFRVYLDLPYLGWLPKLLDRVLAAVRQELTVYDRFQPVGPLTPEQQHALDRAGDQLADLLRPQGFASDGPAAGQRCSACPDCTQCIHPSPECARALHQSWHQGGEGRAWPELCDATCPGYRRASPEMDRA